MSTKESIKIVRDARQRGVEVTTETCPHYLLFTRDDYARYGPGLVANPPLRSMSDVSALWRGLSDGNVDIVVTDHCAYLEKEKEIGWTNVWDTPCGVPELETLVCLMLSEGVNKGRISLEKFIQMLSENPAKILVLFNCSIEFCCGHQIYASLWI